MLLIRDKKGFLFTIAVIILIIPLIYLVSFYSSVSETQMEDVIGRIRCDELHYYVEDVRRDMGRAVTIFGRRAAMYTTDNIILTGVSLNNYVFTCTPECDVNCPSFIPPENGSEAAIAEMILCGTLYGVNVSGMQNNTLPEWIESMEELGSLLRFDVNITPVELRVVPVDAWHFSVEIENKIRVSDQKGLCFYKESIMVARSNTSIIGLPDPLYPLNSEGAMMKQILECESPALIGTKAGCGYNGSGIGGGVAVMYDDDISWSEKDAYREYCNGSSSLLPSTGDLQNQVFVLNVASIPAPLCNPAGIAGCFNASMPRHFNAFLSYNNINLTEAPCYVTIPYITGTGDLENDPPTVGGLPDPGCNDSRIKSGDPLLVLNINESCPVLHSLHYVLLGYNDTDTNTSCYYVSDVEDYNPECNISERYSNGPSFFDRLDGNLNLSWKYVEQANESYGVTSIGVESLVDIYELYNLKILGYNVNLNSTYSLVDYLYWQNVSGCDVLGYCGESEYSLKLDCPHAYKYRLDTGCEKVSKCPVCGDGLCDSLEDCVSCPLDCECPGCPVYLNLSNCKYNCGGMACDVIFNLSVMNQTGYFMNLSANPVINVTTYMPLSSSNYIMNPGGTGRYYHIEAPVNKNRYIGGIVKIREPGCPQVKGDTGFTRVGNETPVC